MNYETANARLTGRNANRRKLANNTYLERREDGSIAVKLHATDILTFHANGDAVLSTGGWRTVTTKARMNEYLSGIRLSQSRGQWYVWDCAKQAEIGLYQDGMILHANGKITGMAALSIATSALKLRRKVQRYAKDYVAALKAGKVPAPSNGDCWGCLMKATDGTMPMGGRDHILSHIDEHYYVPSLLLRSLETFPASIAMKDTVARLWQGDTTNPWGDWIFRQLQKNISRYCLREVGQAA